MNNGGATWPGRVTHPSCPGEEDSAEGGVQLMSSVIYMFGRRCTSYIRHCDRNCQPLNGASIPCCISTLEAVTV